MKQEQVQKTPSKTKQATARKSRLLEVDHRSPSGRIRYAN
jgi:hypothetical protein